MCYCCPTREQEDARCGDMRERDRKGEMHSGNERPRLRAENRSDNCRSYEADRLTSKDRAAHKQRKPNLPSSKKRQAFHTPLILIPWWRRHIRNEIVHRPAIPKARLVGQSGRSSDELLATLPSSMQMRRQRRPTVRRSTSVSTRTRAIPSLHSWTTG